MNYRTSAEVLRSTVRHVQWRLRSQCKPWMSLRLSVVHARLLQCALVLRNCDVVEANDGPDEQELRDQNPV